MGATSRVNVGAFWFGGTRASDGLASWVATSAAPPNQAPTATNTIGPRIAARLMMTAPRRQVYACVRCPGNSYRTAGNGPASLMLLRHDVNPDRGRGLRGRRLDGAALRCCGSDDAAAGGQRETLREPVAPRPFRPYVRQAQQWDSRSAWKSCINGHGIVWPIEYGADGDDRHGGDDRRDVVVA